MFVVSVEVFKMKVYQTIFLFVLVATFETVNAQNENMPAAISDQFYLQYPYASNIKVNKKNRYILVDFIMKNESYHAVYEKAVWKYTLMDYGYERLPAKVKKHFKKTQYAAKEVLETDVIYMPNGYEEYRLRFKNDTLHNRYIYFNEKGRLIRQSPI